MSESTELTELKIAVNALSATLDQYSMRTSNLEDVFIHIQTQLDQIIDSNERAENLVNTIAEKVKPVIEQAGPMIESLSNSPMIKMLGV